ncbi:MULTISPECIES: IS4 family transposase [Streptomyces violaceusniger group]|uniref:IS4 family transposase n=2 Tax=Streptomyces rhizosphaericus TaxID=114699 RepID=A0ABN1RUL8_9ACTN|nr:MULTISPECIES: IS4 family transposase [Streptomyces violaceusniger group]
MQEQSVITREIAVAAGGFAPGHLGELTQVVDFALVDAVLEETGTVQKRVRLLPSRVVVYFVLALALFERCSYRAVWGKLVASLDALALVRPCTSALCRARRRVGSAPFQALFETLAGPVAGPHTPGAFWRGLRTVAIDGTSLHLPDSEPIAARHTKRKRKGEDVEFGYPLLRLLTLIECGTRAVPAAAFGPETTGETIYAEQMLDRLTRGMLVLLDTGFDGYPLLLQLRSTGAEFLCRSGARRIPLITKRLPDGSYLSTFGMGKLPVRIVEAWITVTYQDGTVRREQWRLATSLTDHTRYPARELVTLYHERWQAETAYFSIKATMLDGRILRSHRPQEVEQEVYALLTVYQALVRITTDATAGRPGLDPDRISFTIALETARDQVTTAAGIIPREVTLVSTIGHAILDNLLPARRRQRAKARTRKNPTSKYSKNSLQHPATAQHYTLETEVTVMEDGLKARSKR